MSNFVKVAAFFTCLPSLLLPQTLRWSEPTPLREAPGYLNGYLASSPNGSAIVIWPESNSALSSGGNYFAKILRPGSGWSQATLVSDGSGYLQEPVAVVIANDGMAIASWRQVRDEPVGESQIVVRKLVPGAGWGPMEVLSTDGIYPSLGLAPDGRAHIVYQENQSTVARTLGPGDETWSPPVILGEAQSRPTKIVAGRDLAYVALTFSEDLASSDYQTGVSLASYTADGWHAATRISDAGTNVGVPQVVANNGHVVLSWFTSDSGLERHWVQRLTDSSERFPVPTVAHSFTPGYPGFGSGYACPIALGPDGTVLATCPARGEAVPNCQDASRSGLVPAFYYYLEMFRRPVAGDWSSVEIISDLKKRVVGSPQVLANSFGDTLALWDSEMPCQSRGIAEGIRTPVTRLWRSSEAAWEPEAGWGTASSYLLGLTVDTRGSFRALGTNTDIDYNRNPASVVSTLLTAELVTHSLPTGDLNGDGLIDCMDLSMVRAALDSKVGDPGYSAQADANQDGVVDVRDLAVVAQQLPSGALCQ
ncbi:MAG: dockerin type I domain-containing protein [Bryobacteraceae bacterium]